MAPFRAAGACLGRRVGVDGVIPYTTAQRTQELAPRLVLGAEPRQVFQLVLAQGMRLAFVGISLGLLVLLTSFLKGQLFGVTSTDALTFSTVSLLLCIVALVACFFPAWLAARLDPIPALRYE